LPPRQQGNPQVAHTSRLFEAVKKSRCSGRVARAIRRLADGCRRAEGGHKGSPYYPIFSQLLFVGMYATQGRYNVRVSKLKHYYGLNHVHYLTTSIPQAGNARPSVDGFDSERLRKQWVATLGELGRELKFRILGDVLMPEHFHALI